MLWLVLIIAFVAFGLRFFVQGPVHHHLLLLILPDLVIEPVNGPDPVVPPLHEADNSE